MDDASSFRNYGYLRMNYDRVYTANTNYFGKPFPELLNFFEHQKQKGCLLDVGCGQGRNAIPLVEMGYKVHAVDISKIATDQLSTYKRPGKNDMQVDCLNFLDIQDLREYDYILFDGFFHLNDHDLTLERAYFEHLAESILESSLVVICFADRGDSHERLDLLSKSFKTVEGSLITYSYKEPITQLTFTTRYRLSVLKKI